MGGPVLPSDLTLSTAGLNRILEYEPSDLTLSVEAGMPYHELSRVLTERRQMIPLDPPYADAGTIGGVIASNLSGPRRRLYGTARDSVIGMTFATLEGKLVQTGGMVVKNVAGLDLAKLMIGSFGTLAVITSINFKLHPMPAGTRTFTQSFNRISDALAARTSLLASPLQPAAVDLLKAPAGYQLLIQAGGSTAVLDRYSKELSGFEILEGPAEETAWEKIREMTPNYLNAHPNGAVVRISCGIQQVGTCLESLPPPALARAGSGVVYGYFPDCKEAAGKGLIEFAPPSWRETQELWRASREMTLR